MYWIWIYWLCEASGSRWEYDYKIGFYSAPVEMRVRVFDLDL